MQQGEFVLWDKKSQGRQYTGIVMSVHDDTRAVVLFDDMPQPMMVMVSFLTPTKPPKDLRFKLRDAVEELQVAKKRPQRGGTPQKTPLTPQTLWGDLIERFLGRYPLGFLDDTFQVKERAPRISAWFRFNDILEESNFVALLESACHAELAGYALKSIPSKPNLLSSPGEKQRLKRMATALPEEFTTALQDILFHKDEEASFNRFSAVLAAGEAASWSAVTVFPFLFKPTKNVLVKPRHIDKVAMVFGERFKCPNLPSWQHYKEALAILNRLWHRLRALEEVYLRPKDLLDLQIFVVATCGMRRPLMNEDEGVSAALLASRAAMQTASEAVWMGPGSIRIGPPAAPDAAAQTARPAVQTVPQPSTFVGPPLPLSMRRVAQADSQSAPSAGQQAPEAPQQPVRPDAPQETVQTTAQVAAPTATDAGGQTPPPAMEPVPQPSTFVGPPLPLSMRRGAQAGSQPASSGGQPTPQAPRQPVQPAAPAPQETAQTVAQATSQPAPSAEQSAPQAPQQPIQPAAPAPQEAAQTAAQATSQPTPSGGQPAPQAPQQQVQPAAPQEAAQTDAQADSQPALSAEQPAPQAPQQPVQPAAPAPLETAQTVAQATSQPVPPAEQQATQTPQQPIQPAMPAPQETAQTAVQADSQPAPSAEQPAPQAPQQPVQPAMPAPQEAAQTAAQAGSQPAPSVEHQAPQAPQQPVQPAAPAPQETAQTAAQADSQPTPSVEQPAPQAAQQPVRPDDPAPQETAQTTTQATAPTTVDAAAQTPQPTMETVPQPSTFVGPPLPLAMRMAAQEAPLPAPSTEQPIPPSAQQPVQPAAPQETAQTTAQPAPLS
ncbi:MAG: hypothetical protein LBR22_08070 [Desulfovibrio sp.]|jgi:hypothetical protein|nr:hypothetical protein [Desulfovibrio sp.]